MSQSSPSSNDTLNPCVDSTFPPPPTSKSPSPNITISKAPKPVNVFSNDGSFLERFQRSKHIESEKKQNNESAVKKRAFADRFKNRGKRPLPQECAKDELASSRKKAKTGSERKLSEYEKEVKHYQGHGLKDDGTGVRPLVK